MLPSVHNPFIEEQLPVKRTLFPTIDDTSEAGSSQITKKRKLKRNRISSSEDSEDGSSSDTYQPRSKHGKDSNESKKISRACHPLNIH